MTITAYAIYDWTSDCERYRSTDLKECVITENEMFSNGFSNHELTIVAIDGNDEYVSI